MSEGIPETYQIIGRIGGGNSGVVYKAYHTNLKKYVVLKKIRSEIKDFVDVRAEADLLKNLRHPGLPQVLDFFEASGEIYTVMDFIPGNSNAYRNTQFFLYPSVNFFCNFSSVTFQ